MTIYQPSSNLSMIDKELDPCQRIVFERASLPLDPLGR